LGGVWNALGSDGAGDDQGGIQSVSWFAVRVFPQHQTRRQDLRFRHALGETAVQSEPVWRSPWRADSERQDILLSRLPGQAAASRHPVQWGDSNSGDDGR